MCTRVLPGGVWRQRWAGSCAGWDTWMNIWSCWSAPEHPPAPVSSGGRASQPTPRTGAAARSAAATWQRQEPARRRWLVLYTSSASSCGSVTSSVLAKLRLETRERRVHLRASSGSSSGSTRRRIRPPPLQVRRRVAQSSSLWQVVCFLNTYRPIWFCILTIVMKSLNVWTIHSLVTVRLTSGGDCSLWRTECAKWIQRHRYIIHSWKCKFDYVKYIFFSLFNYYYY